MYVKIPELKIEKFEPYNLKKYFKFKEGRSPKNFDELKLDDIDFCEPYCANFRYVDFTGFDLRDKLDILKHTSFSTFTIFPEDDMMPEGFKKADREKLLEDGKFKNLGIPELRSMGITGKGVKIAIIDQPLNIRVYQEISERIRHYESFGYTEDDKSSLHGCAVSSIMCGQDLGIAPDIELYYFASNSNIPGSTEQNQLGKTYENDIKALDRILQINRELKAKGEEPIVAVSRSFGLKEKSHLKYDEMQAKLAEMEANDVYVQYVGNNKGKPPQEGMFFDGMQKTDDGEYELAPWQKEGRHNIIPFITDFIEKYNNPVIFVPMSTRTILDEHKSPTNPERTQYSYDPAHGGNSWVQPYAVGMFALAKQVQPDITFKEFHKIAQETGTPLKEMVDEKEKVVGKVIQPLRIIEKIKERQAEKQTNESKKSTKTWVKRIHEYNNSEFSHKNKKSPELFMDKNALQAELVQNPNNFSQKRQFQSMINNNNNSTKQNGL